MSNENMIPRHTQSIPILVDNSLNKAMAIKYVIFALFGLAGVVSRLPTVAEFIGGALASFTSAIVCISAAFAAMGAWNSTKGNHWEKVEIYSAIIFVSFSAIWAMASVWLFVAGAADRITSVPLSLALLVMPIWRIRYLIKKNRRP